MSSVTQQAIQMAKAGRASIAVHQLRAAGAGGDVDALYMDAAWHLLGTIVPRDLAVARAQLRVAAEIGHVDAALLEIALTANGSGAHPSWVNALELLRLASRDDPVAQQQLALVNAMQLYDDGTPKRTPSAETLGTEPLVVRFPGLLTPQECAHVASAATDLLEPASVVDPVSGRTSPHPIRTSDAAVIGPMRENLVIRAINLRIAAISGTAIAQGEALTVLRYRPGQQFRPHMDTLSGTRNQRVATVLVYLNHGFGGGETIFPNNGLRIVPRGGDAVLFANVRPDGGVDPASRHAGAPVTAGTKWLATRWIRARAFDPWRGPEAA